MPVPIPPGPEDLRRFAAGALEAGDAARVDAWLASLPEADAARHLDFEMPGMRLPIAMAAEDEGFAPDLLRSRFQPQEPLGEGGMATVTLALDRVLRRPVALKVLKARQAGEGLEQFQLRELAFRQEAALTAGLEHPAIPPVYDVGRAGGRPAFTLQRLSGRTLAQVLAGTPVPALHLVEPLVRAVEAVAYAHAHGVVHRDLTPGNLLLGDFGAVHVLDWGVACAPGGAGGTRVGTPGWMAPEQAAGAPADPRMDVFALGGLLMAVLTGQDPRGRTLAGAGAPAAAADAGPVDLAPLAAPGVPRGLAAVARRCLAAAPGDRYRDGGEVAADLHRWLADGLTLAQEATAAERAWRWVRRSPRLRSALVAAAAVALAVWSVGAWRDAQDLAETRSRLGRIAAEVDLDRPEAVRLALSEVEALAQARPASPEAAALGARLRAAADLHDRHRALAQQRGALADLLARTRRHGPWSGAVADWTGALARAGLRLDGPAAPWHDHPLARELAEALAWTWRAAIDQGDVGLAAHAAASLAGDGPHAGWRALGRLCGKVRFQAHDPLFAADGDGLAALAAADSAAVVTALFAPDAVVQARALEVLRTAPGDFWPLMAAGRAALAAGDGEGARLRGLVASGAEPASMFPPLLLAYAALLRGDDGELARAVGAGLAINPDHGELLGLQAVALARAGHREDAAAVIDRLGAAHLRYHLAHRVGHPMERTVDALIAAGMPIPEAAPDLGPLVPGEHHHH